MHTEAIRKYMTNKKVTYVLEKWDTCDDHYWIAKYDKDGNWMSAKIIYNIDKLWDTLDR
jgi:hypothetical protein